MATSVDLAFQEFNSDFVNLDKEDTKKARNSRDWLIGQLINFPNKIDDFPRLYDGMHANFGSFARNTKIRPLDDVDLILAFSGDGTTYYTVKYGSLYYLNVPETATYLRKLCNEDGTLNSIKLVNKIKSSLNTVDQYKTADIHRMQEAVTLNLSSYDWNFDIVPAFYTDTGYYIIPDGKGNWKATDPRVDQKRITQCNQKFDINALQLIRLLKYWNKNAEIPEISSYLFETLVLDFLEAQLLTNRGMLIYVRDFFFYLWDSIPNAVIDPKKFQDDINDLSISEKEEVSKKAFETYKMVKEAIRVNADEEDVSKSLDIWRQIFGEEFPLFG